MDRMPRPCTIQNITPIGLTAPLDPYSGPACSDRSLSEAGQAALPSTAAICCTLQPSQPSSS